MTATIPAVKTPCLAVFTVDGSDTILNAGYSQSWRLSTQNAAKVDYLVCVQNREEGWGNPRAAHGTAFLVGKISGIAPSKDEGRKLIKISEYALVDVPDAWDGNRNPIAYMSLEDFKIDVNQLKFLPVQAPQDKAAGGSDGVVPLTIDQAKQALSAMFGVSPDQVEITIRG